MQRYDVFGLTSLIERGLSRKLELIENALNTMDSSLEPITIVENYAFVVNTKNAQLYRFSYEVNEGNVRFSNPVPFELDTDLSRFENTSKKLVRNIVEAISENKEEDVDFFKAKWIENQRQKFVLESKLGLGIGSKSKYISNAKKIVAESVASVRGAKSLIYKNRSNSLLESLLKDGEITVSEREQGSVDENASRKQLIFTKIVEYRNSAKSLVESPVFKGYVENLYNKVDIDEAVEFIATNYQELFTLSLAEQTEIFYSILEKTGKPDLVTVVEGVLAVGQYVLNNKEISEDLMKLSALVGADKENFHKRMNLIEDEINSRTFTLNDLKVLQGVLESIIKAPSEFLAAEFVVEARKALYRISSMVESGNVDDSIVSRAINLVSQFYPQTIGEAKEKKKDAYKEFFDSKLTKYNVSSPDELSDEEKKKFFDEIESEWKADDEKAKGKKKEDPNADKTIWDGVNEQTGFPEGSLEKIVAKSKSKKKAEIETAPIDNEDEVNAIDNADKGKNDDGDEDDFVDLKKKGKKKEEMTDDEIVESFLK